MNQNCVPPCPWWRGFLRFMYNKQQGATMQVRMRTTAPRMLTTIMIGLVIFLKCGLLIKQTEKVIKKHFKETGWHFYMLQLQCLKPTIQGRVLALLCLSLIDYYCSRTFGCRTHNSAWANTSQRDDSCPMGWCSSDSYQLSHETQRNAKEEREKKDQGENLGISF